MLSLIELEQMDLLLCMKPKTIFIDVHWIKFVCMTMLCIRGDSDFEFFPQGFLILVNNIVGG